MESMFYEGFEIRFSPFLGKDRIVQTNNIVVMHPYTGAALMLEITSNTYTEVFKQMGVTNHSVDACTDSILKYINIKIEKATEIYNEKFADTK